MEGVSDFARTAYAEAMGAAIAENFGPATPLGPLMGMAGTFVHAVNAAAGTSSTTEGWTEEKAAPPISASALRRFPVIRATEEDLCQDGNDHCCICLEQHKAGDKLLRLSGCGHLYHRECVVPWLRKCASCPNCRYEFESEDPSFNAGLEARMRKRKPRYRMRQLETMPLDALVEIYRERGRGDPPPTRDELIRILVDRSMVDILPEPAPFPVQCSAGGLRAHWPARALKELMARVGVDSTGCVEKSDLVDHLEASGRLEFSSDDDRVAALDALDEFRRDQAARNPAAVSDQDLDSSASTAASCPVRESASSDALSPSAVQSLSVRQLKAELTKRGLEREIRGADKDHLRRTLAAAL